MSQPLVTVIVPIFNVEHYLRHCVTSILTQTHKNLEVLLVDDGSTDGSSALCDAFALEDNRIRVVHQSNGGQSSARNVGLAMMNGEFVTFVDSDDWLHPEMIETLLTYLMDWQADVSCAAFARTADGVGSPIASRTGALVLDAEQALEALVGSRHIQLTVAWAKLYRSELWAELRFPVGRRIDDEFTTYRTLYASRRVVVADQPLYYYRQHDESIMGSQFSVQRGLDSIDAFKGRADFLAEEGLEELSALAYQEAFKKYVQLHSWLGRSEPGLRAQLVADMQDMLEVIGDDRQPLAFRVLSRLCVQAPSLGSAVYRGQARLRRLAIPNR